MIKFKENSPVEVSFSIFENNRIYNQIYTVKNN